MGNETQYKLYIAAPFELQSLGQSVRKFLQHTGRYVITSRWLDEDPHKPTSDSDDDAAIMAERDITDIENAHALVAINPAEYRKIGTGGRHFEMGYVVAINRMMRRSGLVEQAVGLPAFILGVKSNVFHRLPEIRIATENPNELIAALDRHFNFLP